MKKVLSLVLVLAMVLGSFSFVSAAAYNDVVDTVFESAVDRLSLLGILDGYPDGTFKPEASITRAEFAAVAVRAKGLEAVAQAAKGLATGFKDVLPTSWASGYVGTAGRLGIVNGVGNGLFAPEAPVKYEEAVTMIVRALGYEAAAQAKGGYPYGYLIVANENGLLDAVKGTQGVAATRGLVAQLTDNALEIPMMVQVGYGSEIKWVVSGSKEHGGDEKYLLDEMGFDTFEGRVTEVNTKRNEITLKNDDESKTLDVAEDFDLYSVSGLTIKAWYANDEVILYTVKDEAKFDAVSYDEDEKELTLVKENENYEVARDAYLVLDGKKVAVKDLSEDFEADYAKVVLNDDDEIVWAEGYTLDGFIVVEEVKNDIAYSYDDYDELKIKDYLIVKDGKTIAADAIEEEDILFFNVDEDFAVVYNNGKEGEFDRVYTDDTFRFEGSAYSYTKLATPAVYFDEGKIGELDSAILSDFLDDEVKVTVYVDFAGKVVLVSGEVNSVGNSAYAVLTRNATKFTGRKGVMVALDLRNGANEKVSYDIEEADLADLGEVVFADLKENVVLKLTVDKDGDVTAIELPEVAEGEAKSFDIDDANVKVGDYSYKLQSSTIVFYDGNAKAITLGNAKDKFSAVEEGSIVYVEKGRVVAVVGETDTDADTKNVTGVVTGVKVNTNGTLQFQVKVFGTTQRLVTEEKTVKYYNDLTDKENSTTIGKDNIEDYKKEIMTFVVGETSGEIKKINLVRSQELTITKISGRTITGKDSADETISVELNSNAVIYDSKLETVNLRNLEVKDVITVYFQGSSKRFVDYVKVGEVAKDPVVTGVVTYINADRLFVGETRYALDKDTVLKNAAGDIVKVGGTDIAGWLTIGDEITKVTVVDGVATVIEAKTIAKGVAADEAAYNSAKTAATDAVNALFVDETATPLVLAAGVDQDDVDAAQLLVNKLKAADQTALQTLIDAAEGLLYDAAKIAATDAVNALFVDETATPLVLAVGVDQDDVDAAQLLVDELKAADQTALQTLIDAAEGLLYDAAKIAATDAVNALFVDETATPLVLAAGVDQDDVDAAQLLVDELKAADQTALQTLIDAAQELVAIAEVDGAADKFAMKTALETYATVLGLDMTDYNGLSASDKLVVADYVGTQDTTTVAKINTAFEGGLELVK